MGPERRWPRRPSCQLPTANCQLTPEAALVATLAASRKYGAVAPAALHRFAADALSRHSDPADALVAARRALHQACGALHGGAVARLRARLAALDPADPAAVRALATAALRAHLSTTERLPHLDRVYAALWERCGPPGDLLDLGGGLSAFALPWMGLPDAARYDAVDLDGRAVALAGAFLARCRRPGRIVCADLLGEAPPATSGVALCWKVLPTLERQSPGAAERLLGAIRARTIVVGFPTRSMGGRAKGMAATYGALLAGWCKTLGRRPSTPWTVGRETFFALPGTLS